jgi:predicted PurR-regulated permease PerM|tara:strand:+ start:410 stop:1468 length:1059 start_codon:yes stop_codon:yes gene_type:complete
VIKIKNTNLSTNIQLLFFALAIVLFYLLLKPVLNIFLASIILTYVFYPLYKKIKIPLKYESLSIFITLVLIVILFLMPFVFVASQIPKQVESIYDYAKTNIIDKGFFDINCQGTNSIKCNAFNFVTGSGYFDFDKIVDTVFKKTIGIATSVVVQIPNIIIAIGLALFISFFLFKDGKKLMNNVVQMIPLQQKYSNRLIEKFGKVTHSVVFAHIIVAIAQGALGALGFYVFGVPSAIFWGVVMAIFALLPLIGPAIIWLPASLLLILNGVIINSYWGMGMGIGLLLYGIFIISMSDNLLRIKLVGGKGDVHPLTVLIGLIGGINLFGLIGIFIGPIALSLLITFLKDFSGSYK